MSDARVLAAVVLGMALSACNQSVADAGDVSTPPAQTVAPATGSRSLDDGNSSINSETHALAAQLSAGMAYSDLRDAALAADWLPVQDNDCPEKTGGQALVCRELPELEACSSDGRCNMRFGHADSRSIMRVDAFGDYTKWRVPGNAAVLNVRNWRFSEAQASNEHVASVSISTACPAVDFQTFLQVFSANESVQQAFTQPLVKIVGYRELLGNSETYPALVRAEDYSGFRLAHNEGGFRVLHAGGGVGATATPVEVTETPVGDYVVSYRYGMSEGRTYLFTKQSGCWYLAAEPEPPTP